MKNFALIVLSLCLFSCSSQKMIQEERINTTELKLFVDSLSELYLVDAKLNMDYLNRHPVLKSDMERIEDMIIKASDVYVVPKMVIDSIGSFCSRPITTMEERQKIRALHDSLSWLKVYPMSILDGQEHLSERYDLNYSLAFNGMDVDKMKNIRKEAFVVNNESKDSTVVEITDLKFAMISKVPQIFAYVFTIDYGGHQYVIHRLYDIRSWSEKRAGKPNKTTGCYQIK